MSQNGYGLPEEDPECVLLSIEGVGAFDHISRARFFEKLDRNSYLHNLIPFAKMWYGNISRFFWADVTGKLHEIRQADRGEQRNALMPQFFHLAMRQALIQIEN